MLSYIPYLAKNLATCSIFESSGPKAKTITDKALKNDKALDLNDKMEHVLVRKHHCAPVCNGLTFIIPDATRYFQTGADRLVAGDSTLCLRIRKYYHVTCSANLK